MWQNLIKFLFYKFPQVEKFRRQWNANHIYSNKNSEMTFWNRFKREKFVVLAEYLEQQTDYRWCKRKISKSRRGFSWRRNQPCLFTFPYQTNGNHATELLTVGHVISERHWKSILDFTGIANTYELKRGTVCQIVRFIYHFSLKLYIQYLKYFHSMVSGSVGRDYSK